MTDSMTSQNIDLSSWDTLYNPGVIPSADDKARCASMH
jgi:hypothetical protein